MKSLQLMFTKERETKGAVRYAQAGVAPGTRAEVGTLYLTKPAAEQLGNPESIGVTIENPE